MPIGLSAKKSLRQSERNHSANVALKTKVKLAIKTYLAKPTADGLKSVYAMMDKAVKKNIFHKNKVARLKSSYSKKLVKSETAKPKKVSKTAKKMS